MPIMHFHNGALVAAFFVASGCIAAPTGLAKARQRNGDGIDTDDNRLIQKGMVVLSHLVNGVQQAGRVLDRIDRIGGLDTSTYGVKQPQQLSPTNANEYGVKTPLPRIGDANLAAEAAKEQAERLADMPTLRDASPHGSDSLYAQGPLQRLDAPRYDTENARVGGSYDQAQRDHRKEQVAHHYETPQPLPEPVYETVGPPKLPPRNVRWQSTNV
jgi:hypothetical protein